MENSVVNSQHFIAQLIKTGQHILSALAIKNGQTKYKCSGSHVKAYGCSKFKSAL